MKRGRAAEQAAAPGPGPTVSESESASGSEEEEDEEDEEVVEEYIGAVDAAGKHHGRATVRYTNGNLFRGRYAHWPTGPASCSDCCCCSSCWPLLILSSLLALPFPAAASNLGQRADLLLCTCCAESYSHGLREGKGGTDFPDGSSLTGTFRADALDGPALLAVDETVTLLTLSLHRC